MADKTKDMRVTDRAAIQDVIYRWCQGVDRRDYDAIRGAYHPDAFDDHGAYSGDVDGFIAWVRNRHETIPFSMHMVTNIVIDFASEATALVESYVWLVQVYPKEGLGSLRQFMGPSANEFTGLADFMTCGRYIDRMERRDGNWKIARRSIVTGRMMVRELFVPLEELPGWIGDRRDPDDHLFKERRALGISS